MVTGEISACRPISSPMITTSARCSSARCPAGLHPMCHGERNMATLRAASTTIRIVKGGQRRSPASRVRYLRWAIRPGRVQGSSQPHGQDGGLQDLDRPVAHRRRRTCRLAPEQAPTVVNTEPPSASRWTLRSWGCAGTTADQGAAYRVGVVSGEKRRRRRLLLTTKTELNAMAAPAITGLSRPRAARGMAATL